MKSLRRFYEVRKKFCKLGPWATTIIEQKHIYADLRYRHLDNILLISCLNPLRDLYQNTSTQVAVVYSPFHR